MEIGVSVIKLPNNPINISIVCRLITLMFTIREGMQNGYQNYYANRI
ncbi:hypothetical protein SPWS13_4223 [Shewanella putrefaciens]|nr:hypothetical protein SPWS13_4223 [Shewanella putrefaciens]